MVLDHKEIGKGGMKIITKEAKLWQVFKMKSGDATVVVHRGMLKEIVHKIGQVKSNSSAIIVGNGVISPLHVLSLVGWHPLCLRDLLEVQLPVLAVK